MLFWNRICWVKQILIFMLTKKMLVFLDKTHPRQVKYKKPQIFSVFWPSLFRWIFRHGKFTIFGKSRYKNKMSNLFIPSWTISSQTKFWSAKDGLMCILGTWKLKFGRNGFEKSAFNSSVSRYSVCNRPPMVLCIQDKSCYFVFFVCHVYHVSVLRRMFVQKQRRHSTRTSPSP